MKTSLYWGMIPGARLHIFTDIGHTPHWEDPEGFVRALLAAIG